MHRILKIILLILALLLLRLGLNYRELIAYGTIPNETARMHPQSKNPTAHD